MLSEEQACLVISSLLGLIGLVAQPAARLLGLVLSLLLLVAQPALGAVCCVLCLVLQRACQGLESSWDGDAWARAYMLSLLSWTWHLRLALLTTNVPGARCSWCWGQYAS